MPRHHRRAPAPGPIGVGSRSYGAQDAEWGGDPYRVRVVGGSEKAYRCPGCDQEIMGGRPHVVAWPSFDSGAGDRRHWHQACWQSRETRGPAIKRSRNAPRY